jgi:hypothetical protein
MGVYEGRGALGKAIKDLTLRWADTKIEWDDPVSQALEADFLVPMEQDLRNCLAAMDHAAIVLQQVRRDCVE